VLIGDDQNENYRDDLPQFAIYTGGDLIANDRQTETQVRHPAIQPSPGTSW